MDAIPRFRPRTGMRGLFLAHLIPLPGTRIITKKENDLIPKAMAVLCCAQAQERHGPVCPSAGAADTTIARPSSHVRPSTPRVEPSPQTSC
jgi:hypothetical protein